MKIEAEGMENIFPLLIGFFFKALFNRLRHIYILTAQERTTVLAVRIYLVETADLFASKAS